MSFINEHRERFGVEPICDTLQVAPSTYYAALSRPASARQVRDGELKVEIARVHQKNFDVYGTEKVWKQLRRESVEVGRDRVGRLMAELELEGAVRGKTWRTTIPSSVGSRPADLVDRDFNATAPNRLWVADLTYVSTWVSSTRLSSPTSSVATSLVGRSRQLCVQTSRSTPWRWRSGHEARGTSRAWSITPTAASSTSPFATPNAYKTELIRKRGPWRSVEQLELATARWVEWYNQRRLHSSIGDVPPAEFETTYHRERATSVVA